jgi:hypothetical protein
MSLWTLLCGIKNVNAYDAEGLNAVAENIEAFRYSSFLVRDGGWKYTVYDYSQMQSFLMSLPQEFVFRSEIKTYNDRSGHMHLHIILKGSVGLCSQFNRYNPLNRTYVILATSSGKEPIQIANKAQSE